MLAVLYPADEFKPLDAAAIFREYSRLRRAAAAVRLRHDGTACSRPPKAASGSCSKAPRAHCSTSTTARIPFVTSSNSSGVGIASGSGVPARYIDHIIGVVKAYSTRVGGGPFPDRAG